nr:hypothetical protein [Tanacetum cinerariifolium]
MVAATEPKTIQKAMQLVGTLTDEAFRNGLIKKNPEKRGNIKEPSKDRTVRYENKRTRMGNNFTTTTNLGREGYTGSEARGNHQNQVLAINEGQGHGNQGNQERGRAFMLGEEEARQDPNIMTDTFTLNDHYATTLFDSGTDYSFVSTTFIHVLDIEPNDLGFSYEIEIASRQLVEIDKVIKGYKLEIEGHAKIIYHEKLVRIPLRDGKVLRVLREKQEEKIKQLMSTKAKENDQEKIVVVRDFTEANVVADALSMKERVKPKRVRAMNMTLQSSIKDRTLTTHKEAFDESEMIAMDFVTKLPRTSSGHDKIWVIVDRLTKSAYFLPTREDYKMDRLARLYLNEIVARHGVSISIISNRDSRFTLRSWQSMQEALGTWLDMNFGGSWDVHLPLVKFSYNNSYHSSMRCASFEALYGRKWRSVCGLRLEKSYIDKRRKPLEFSVGDYVLLKVSPWKGVKCLADLTLQVPLDEIQVDAKLNFMEEPVEILERVQEAEAE